jgi:hemoglobin
MNILIQPRSRSIPRASTLKRFAFSLPIGLFLLAFVVAALTGCGATVGKKEDEFFTSGSREADQRASQNMAKAKQLAGAEADSTDRGTRKAKSREDGSADPKGVQAQAKLSLYDRLGGEPALVSVVDDFLPRALQDPRINWERKDVKRGVFRRSANGDWEAKPENVATLKKHLVQFLALTTGGPAQYDGKEMKSTHAGMSITNPEFDAAIGDLKATLDKLQVPDREQKELLAIVESTRPQIVTVR